MQSLLLASGSVIRAKMLRDAGIPFEARSVRIDEDALRQAMEAEETPPRDMADHLAEMKASKASSRAPDVLVLGCDQILEFEGRPLAKPRDENDALQQLLSMSEKTHFLHSAAVLVRDGQPVWRHTGTVRMNMRALSQDYLEGYVQRNWEEIRHCVGAYQLESEGVRLFRRVDGDYFTVLGLPLLPLLEHLARVGVIET